MVDPKTPKIALYQQFGELVKELAAAKNADVDAWQILAVTAVQALMDTQSAIVTLTAAVAATAEKLAQHRESVEELIGAVDELRTGGSPTADGDAG